MNGEVNPLHKKNSESPYNGENYQRFLANGLYSIIKKRLEASEKEISLEDIIRKIRKSLDEVKGLKISSRVVCIKSWLREGGLEKIFDKNGKEIWTKKADGEDLEKYIEYQFGALGVEYPENYSEREQQ